MYAQPARVSPDDGLYAHCSVRSRSENGACTCHYATIPHVANVLLCNIMRASQVLRCLSSWVPCGRYFSFFFSCRHVFAENTQVHLFTYIKCISLQTWSQIQVPLKQLPWPWEYIIIIIIITMYESLQSDSKCVLQQFYKRPQQRKRCMVYQFFNFLKSKVMT